MVANNNPRKLLLFGEYGSLNGGENSILAAIPHLFANGWTVSAAVPSDSHFSSALEAAKVTTHPLWLTGLGGERLSQNQIRSSLANLIRETKPDLVHGNSLSTSRLLGPVVSELGIRGSGHLRDIIKLSAKAVSDINQLDRIIAVSKATANFHISQGMDDDKLRVVYNGVDLELFNPSTKVDYETDVRKELEIAEDTFLVLCIGQIGMRKGVENVIDAMTTPVQQQDDVHLLMVGERHSVKDEAIEYERMCKQKGGEQLGKQIHWLGRRIDVPRLMRQSNMLIHLPKQEPLGRVLLEASAAGLPIITTDVGGTREILRDLDELILPALEDFRGCFDMKKYRDDTKFRERVSGKLRKNAEQFFPAQLAGENLAREFDLIMND